MPPLPKLTSRTIKYNSPSGKINIGKYVPPFEKIKNGFGFLGVVIEDFKSGQLQCNICGNWHENLPTHLRCHNITAREYKERFGLGMATALKSKRMRLIQSEVMQKMRKSNKKHRMTFKKGNKISANRKGKFGSVETINKYGVCELQIADRVSQLANKLKRTPKLTELKDEYGAGFIHQVEKRYDSYVHLCKKLELTPHISNANPKYSREYFIEKALSNEPTLRIFTQSEARNLYKYFPKGIKELKVEVKKYKKTL